MTINRTTLLDLPLPVTGTESGTWGDIVNNGLSEYIDISVAGSLSLSADSDTDLSSTEGNAAGTNIGSTTAQYAILRCTGARTATRNINAPAWAISGGTLTNYSKIYIVVNETTGSQNIVLRATNSATPTYTTGVTIVPGERAVCAWNGSDFVKVGGAAGGSTTQIQFNNAGVFGGSANLTWDGTNVQIGATGALRLADTDSSNYVAFKSPGTVASNVTWTLPSADGTNGQALTTNGSGTLAFSSVTTSPGGSTTQVQYNNAGAFGGSANFVWDNSNVRLGIGTSSPNVALDVVSGSVNTVGDSLTDQTSSVTGPNRAFSTHVGVLNVATNTAAGIDVGGSIGFGGRWTGTTQAGFALIKGAKESASTSYASYLAFYTRPDSAGMSERMRITSGGNLLVGTTSTSLASATTGTGLQYIPNNAVIVAANGGNACLIANKTDSTTGSTAIFRYNGSTVGDISITSTNAAYNTASLSTDGAQLNYQGITFRATQSASSDANTLDDYEEGTWTPTAVGATTAGTTTYTTQTGVYTKIGRQVTVTARLSYSAMTGTGVLNLGGLPFTVANLGLSHVGSVATNNLNWVGGTSIAVFAVANQTYCEFFGSADDGAWNQQTCVNESADINYTVTYFTT